MALAPEHGVLTKKLIGHGINGAAKGVKVFGVAGNGVDARYLRNVLRARESGHGNWWQTGELSARESLQQSAIFVFVLLRRW